MFVPTSTGSLALTHSKKQITWSGEKWSKLSVFRYEKNPVALFSVYWVVLGIYDILRLKKKNRLFFPIFNYRGQNLTSSAICLQGKGTSLLNGFKYQKKFYNNELLGNWNLFTIYFLFVLDEFADLCFLIYCLILSFKILWTS